MCGISGIINPKENNAYNTVDIRRMTDAIKHRGPDDVGYLLVQENGKLITAGDDDTPQDVFNNTAVSYRPQSHITAVDNGSFALAFGHRRVSILDL